MGSHCVEILRQGIWASLTGGWYYDPHQDIFSNTVHLYLWLYLMCAPFCVFLYSSLTWMSWVLHVIILTIITLVIKSGNYYLHHLFDTGERHHKEVQRDVQTPEASLVSPGSHNGPLSSHDRASSFEAVELQVVNESRDGVSSPLNCSSQNSIISTSNLMPTSIQNVIDLKVDVHRNESSESERESTKFEQNEDSGNMLSQKHVPETKHVSLEEYCRPEVCRPSEISGIILSEDKDHNKVQHEKTFLGEQSSLDSFKYFADESKSHGLCQKNVKWDFCSGSTSKHETEGNAKKYYKCLNSKDKLIQNSFNDDQTRVKNNGSANLVVQCGPKNSKDLKKAGRPYKSCRATPEFTLDTNISTIAKGDRSCSAPNCSLANTNLNRGILRDPLQHRRSFCNELEEENEGRFDSNTLCKEKDRKKMRKSQRERTRDLEKTNMFPSNTYIDTAKPVQYKKSSGSEEELCVKDTFSSLLFSEEYNGKSSAPSIPASVTNVYHPLVFRRTTSLSKDALQVTALTFENVYSEARNVEKNTSSSSSEDVIGSSLVETIDPPSPFLSPKVGQKDIEVELSTSALANALPDTRSDSSSPDIDWLFCHSDSDSECVKTRLQPPKEFQGSNKRDNPGVYSSQIIDSSDNSKNSNLSSFNLRDPEGASRHGAIPKRRRQGVVVRDSRDSTDSVEAAGVSGVTMDLVRKMLDVFSSYPDNKQKDIKKFMVLVSLEQEKPSINVSPDDTVAKEDSSDVLDYKSPLTENLGDALSHMYEEHSITYKTQADSKLNDTGEDIIKDSHMETICTPCQDDQISVSLSSPNNPHDIRSRSFTVRRRTISSDLKDDTYVQNSFPGKENWEDEIPEFEEVDSGEESGEIKSKLNCEPSTHSPTAGTSVPGLKMSLSSKRSNWKSKALHLASSHDDTTSGAVHCFQDEHGRWFTYTFNNLMSRERSNWIPKEDNGESVTSYIPSPYSSLSDSTISLSSSGTEGHEIKGGDGELCRNAKNDMHTKSVKSTCQDSGRDRTNNQDKMEPLVQFLGPERNQIEWINSDRTGNFVPSDQIPRVSSLLRDLTPATSNFYAPPSLHFNLGHSSNPLQLLTSALFERRRLADRLYSTANPSSMDSYLDVARSTNYDVSAIVKQLKFETPHPTSIEYYKLNIFGKVIKLNFDRLSLLALFDRNLTLFESIANVFLVVMVGLLGSIILFKGHYHEFSSFLFCFVTAGCQYSLFKSVQPDAGSPTHGYNRIILYSRPVYYCLCTALIIGVDFYLNSSMKSYSFFLYGFELTSPRLLVSVRDVLLLILLGFPLLFTFGLLPQVNTFIMYFLEQVDIHVFGGNATTSLSSACYCIFRSIASVLFLAGFAYGGLREASRNQHILYSIFCALTVAFSYHLSRSAANPNVLFQLIQKYMLPDEVKGITSNSDEDPVDPLPKKLRRIVTDRLTHDLIICSLIVVIVFAIHSSSVFNTLLSRDRGSFPELQIIIWILASVMGLINHYIIPQLRTQQPWMCFSRPACLTHEYSQFEVYDAARLMWFERLSVWLCLIEKNILYPVLFLCALTKDADVIMTNHSVVGVFIIVICSLKCLRNAYSQNHFQYLILVFTILFFNWDTRGVSESFLVDYFMMLIIFNKVQEFLLKLKFIITYIAPWQITWGSAFHAFAQPFSVPHSAMLFIQAAMSCILSTPLNPVLGSAIFISSYVRPIKFWERDYNTKRIDQTNTRLSSLLEQNPGADDNNLNSIFYEHLTHSLQHSLCGDLILGRWGAAMQGDCFVLASDNLNCLVHIIELGNGLVTFQVRGLEFRGTYCQQREVEAISEGIEEDRGCCCCEVGHFPNMLSVNAAFNQRWLAWEVTATKYVLEGYSISDNSAVSMFQMFELRRILISYYVKCIIFYVVDSSKLHEWMTNESIKASLDSLNEKNFVDLDPTFHMKIDEDFDYKASGITRSSFCSAYLDWILFCVQERNKHVSDNEAVLIPTKDSYLVSLCLALSLLGRRALGPSSQCENVELFLQFLHSLFKGDIRPTCVRDEWVFADMELLRKVVSPALRISLKLHQDHFLLPDEYDDHGALYSAIRSHRESLVICHEGNSEWRGAVLGGRPSLLSLRHVNDDGEDKFKIIMLNKRHLLFRVIKVNRECVRGLWAGQQQELIFLRNRNPERGSIQNAKQALRNIINSSCDQPIGYPIYVSPLTTSYAETHSQLTSFAGGAITPSLIKNSLIKAWERIRARCVEGCSGGSSGLNEERVSRAPCLEPSAVQLRQVLSTLPMGGNVSQDLPPLGPLGSSGSGIVPFGGSLPVIGQRAAIALKTSSGTPGTHIKTVVTSVPHSKAQLATLFSEVEGPNNSFRTAVDGRDIPLMEINSAYKINSLNSRDTQVQPPRLAKDWNPDKMRGTREIPSQSAPHTDHETENGRESRLFQEIHSSHISSQNPPHTVTITSRPQRQRGSKSKSGALSTDDPQRVSQWDRKRRHHVSQRVRIVDANYVYDTLNLGRKIDVIWPEEQMRSRGGRNVWGSFVPVEGMEGNVVHTWKPHHHDPKLRSHVDRTIYLVKIQDYFVPVAKSAVRDVTGE